MTSGQPLNTICKIMLYKLYIILWVTVAAKNILFVAKNIRWLRTTCCKELARKFRWLEIPLAKNSVRWEILSISLQRFFLANELSTHWKFSHEHYFWPTKFLAKEFLSNEFSTQRNFLPAAFSTQRNFYSTNFSSQRIF